MLNKILLEEILGIALSGGADFAEVFCECTRNGRTVLIDGKIESVTEECVSGVGIRAFRGTSTVYGSTSDISREGLIRCARGVAAAMGEIKEGARVHLTERIFPNIHPARISPSSADGKYKCELVRRAAVAATEYDSRIVQAAGTLLTVDRTVQIANTEGLLTSDRHVRSRLMLEAIAEEGAEKQSGSCRPGRGMGLEFFEQFTPEMIGKEAARQAIVNLGASYISAGKMPVAIESGFGGVIFHEACGHSLEASAVGIGMSEMCGKLGKKIANEKVTAIDDGTIVGAWGSVNIDDEGTPTARNVLIENGVLKGYMIDRLGSHRGLR